MYVNGLHVLLGIQAGNRRYLLLRPKPVDVLEGKRNRVEAPNMAPPGNMTDSYDPNGSYGGPTLFLVHKE